MQTLRLLALMVVSLGAIACAPAAPFLPPASVASFADCNQDGRYTWGELSKTTYGVRGETQDRAFTFANFAQADANGDEVLTLSELRAWFEDKNANGYNFNRTCE